MTPIFHNDNPTTGVDADHPGKPLPQSLSTHIDTGGGSYVGGNVNADKFVGRDDNSVTNQTLIVNPSEVKPLPPQPPAPPPLFIGWQAELRQLGEWLTAVTPNFLRNGNHPEGKMALLYGPGAAGKSTLIRHWLADLQASQQPPIIAHLSFQRELLVGKYQPVAELSQSRYSLAWEEPDDKLVSQFPTPFPLDCYFWVTLAVQLACQSPQLRQALTSDRKEEWTRELCYNTPLPPTEALTTLLEFATREGRPIILACEGLQHCAEAWFDLFKAWAKAIRSKQWPVLLLLEYDYPQPFTAPTIESQIDARLEWLRQRCGAPYFLAEACYLAPFNLHEIEAILLPGSQHYAHDLFLMSEGIPKRVHDLLNEWRKQGAAQERLPGYWQVDWLPTNIDPFLADEPLLTIVNRSLARSAERAADLGYQDVNTDTLREWLNHAVWEGDAFHDQALALAVGWQGDALNDFLTIVDEALCRSEQHPQGLLEEIEGYIELPYGDNQTRYLTRYRFVQPLVTVLLRQRQQQRQHPEERIRDGLAYAQALETVYATDPERILETVATIYQSLGLTQIAAGYRQRWNMLLYLAQEEAALSELLPLDKEEEEQKSFVRRILRFFNDAYNRRHPGQLLPWLQEALALSRQLRDQWSEARTLHSIGLVYYALREYQQALTHYQQALLYRQVGDIAAEAATLHQIGLVHYALREYQQALDYYQQALPLHHQVGDMAEAAKTLYSIGRVYSDLREYQQALTHYQQAITSSVRGQT